MTRTIFEQELQELNLDLIRMGSMAEEAISQAMQALNTCDIALAKKVIENDDRINDATRHIESRSMKIIMKQQPVASDLRAVSAALKMATDLERIGDQAADIAEIAISLCKHSNTEKPEHLKDMEDTAIKMVKSAVDCYVRMDEPLAENVIAMDDEQDALFNTTKNELMDIAYQSRDKIDYVADYLMIIKYLERISDHAENIADWTLFAISGIHKNEHIL